MPPVCAHLTGRVGRVPDSDVTGGENKKTKKTSHVYFMYAGEDEEEGESAPPGVVFLTPLTPTSAPN